MSSSTLADFELLGQLGKGSYGTVFKVRRKGEQGREVHGEGRRDGHQVSGPRVALTDRRPSRLFIRAVSLSLRSVDDRIYVLKQICIGGLSLKEQRDCVVEVRLLASLDSPFVVRYFDSFLEGEQSASTLNIIMEFCEKGDLQQRLKVGRNGDRGDALGQRDWTIAQL